ncbi:MAG: diguanylate cyclase [Acidobacteriota bacterium]
MRQRHLLKTLISVAVSGAVVFVLALQGLALRKEAAQRVGIFFGPEVPLSAVEVDPEPGLRIERVEVGLAAHRAGIRAGDVLMAVDRQPVADLDRYGEILDERIDPDFSRNDLHWTLWRNGREIDLLVVPGSPFPLWGFLSTVLACLSFLVLALTALLASAESKRSRLLFLLCLAISLELALPLSTAALIDLPVLLAFSYLLSGLQLGTEVHLISRIPEPHRWARRYPWIIPAVYALGFAAAALAATTELATARGIALPWSVDTIAFFFNNAIILPWALAVALLLLNQSLFHEDPHGRMKASWVLAGALPWVIYSVYISSVDLFGFPLADWALDLTNIVVLPFPIALFVAIFRYRLLDVRAGTARSFVYSLLAVAVLLVFYLALGTLGIVMLQALELGNDSVWVISGATLLLGLTFSPLRTAIQRALERRFFPEQAALSKQLTELASDLPQRREVPKMSRYLVDKISEALHLESATLLLTAPRTGLLITSASTLLDAEEDFAESFLLSQEDPALDLLLEVGGPLSARRLAGVSPALAHRLHAFEARLAVPLINRDHVVGLLLLGRGSEAFQPEELEVLSLFARHTATTFENARLFESATVEGLTGLLRREAILERLTEELDRSLRYRRPLSVAMIDLDHFKRVNDRFGHLMGDALLKRVAQVLQRNVRRTDSLGRYGGEEFLLVMPETRLVGAAEVSEKIRRMVEGLALLTEGEEKIQVTLSIGLSQLEDFNRSTAPSAEELIAAADLSLYEAKRQGRNRVRQTQPLQMV